MGAPFRFSTALTAHPTNNMLTNSVNIADPAGPGNLCCPPVATSTLIMLCMLKHTAKAPCTGTAEEAVGADAEPLLTQAQGQAALLSGTLH